MELAAEQQLGNYRLIGRLGAGGMGDVWHAEDLKLRRMVAIKVLSRATAQNDESRARLIREARTAAQLAHPNIATIHSIEEHDGHSFIVMEYIRGESLRQRLAGGPLSDAEVIWIARQIAEALKEAHSLGIIHRDIKPDNVMLTGDRLKVLDFGIAKRIGPDANHDTFQEYATREGMVLGTLFYMSPEQALGKELDTRTDIYSLGVLMYQLLTGSLPFVGDTATDTITRIIRDEAPSLRSMKPSVSSPLENLVERCMQKNRDYRYADAGELIAALDRLTISTGTAPVEVTTAMSASNTLPTVPMSAATASGSLANEGAGGRKLLWFAAAAAVIVLIAGVLFITRDRGASASSDVPAAAASVLPVSSTPAESLSPAPDPGPSVTVQDSVLIEPAENDRASVQESATEPAPIVVESSVPDSKPAETEVGEKAESLHREGLAMILRNRPAAALASFRSALEADPSYAPSRLKLAQLLLKANPAEAERQFRRALQDRERLDARQVAIAEIGIAIAGGDLAQARLLGGRFASSYPNDPDLQYLQKEGEKILRDRGTSPRRRN